MYQLIVNSAGAIFDCDNALIGQKLKGLDEFAGLRKIGGTD